MVLDYLTINPSPDALVPSSSSSPKSQAGNRGGNKEDEKKGQREGGDAVQEGEEEEEEEQLDEKRPNHALVDFSKLVVNSAFTSHVLARKERISEKRKYVQFLKNARERELQLKEQTRKSLEAYELGMGYANDKDGTMTEKERLAQIEVARERAVAAGDKSTGTGKKRARSPSLSSPDSNDNNDEDEGA